SLEEEQLLKTKGLGAAIHISNFLLETIKQLKDRCVGVFAFNNTTSYKAFSENTLVALKMNLGLGDLTSK
ncbi:5158_t:CDS:2, partial [Cetraspora pellucida]